VRELGCAHLKNEPTLSAFFAGDIIRNGTGEPGSGVPDPGLEDAQRGIRLRRAENQQGYFTQGAIMQMPDWLACIQQAEQLFDSPQLEEPVDLAESALRMPPAAAPAYQVLGDLFVPVLLEIGSQWMRHLLGRSWGSRSARHFLTALNASDLD